MPTPVEVEVERLLGRLSYQDQQRVLRNLIWDVFGDVDEEGADILVPGRGPDKVDVLSLLTSLRQEFWPEDFPAGSAADDFDPWAEEDTCECGSNRDDCEVCACGCHHCPGPCPACRADAEEGSDAEIT